MSERWFSSVGSADETSRSEESEDSPPLGRAEAGETEGSGWPSLPEELGALKASGSSSPCSKA
eukprot:1670221-Alexandrium_andersonii.AAC.1